MTPSPEQKQWLKSYLRKTMKYRETYEEVYDHMLLSIENHPEQQYFATVVLDVLEKDFGGFNGLVELEESCRKSVEETTQNHFKDNFRRWFNSPLLIVTTAIFMCLFYLQLPNVETHSALPILFIVLLVLPTIICSVRAVQLGYSYGESKASIKDEAFMRLAFISDRFLLKLLLTSVGVQQVTRILFKLDNTIGALIGFSFVCLCIWFTVQKFKKERYSFKGMFFRRNLISVPLFLLMLFDSLVSKYFLKTSWPSEKSLGHDGLYILYGLTTVVLLLMIINVFAVIKLYRAEVKTNMVAN